MAADFDTGEAFGRAIGLAVEQMAGALREDAIASAVAKFESDLRERVAVAAMKVQNTYRVERMGAQLAIFVKIEDVR